jgi:hypothetical protein
MNQIVYPSDLVDSFEISFDNSFFSFSRIAQIQNADFTITLNSTTSMFMSSNQTRLFRGSVFIFRTDPHCPMDYAFSQSNLYCVCNSLSCYEEIGCSSVVTDGNLPTCIFCSISDHFIEDANGLCACKAGYEPINDTCV